MSRLELGLGVVAVGLWLGVVVCITLSLIYPGPWR